MSPRWRWAIVGLVAALVALAVAVRAQTAETIQIDSDVNQAVLVDALDRLQKVHARVPLTKFTFRADNGTPATDDYIYRFDAVDGRIWRQTLIFDDPVNPRMTFNVADPGWRLDEFSVQRAVRDQIVELHRLFGMTRLVVEWT